MIFSLDDQLEPIQEYPRNIQQQAEEAVNLYGRVFVIETEQRDCLKGIIAAAIHDHMALENYGE